jgi:hypothetical protein
MNKPNGNWGLLSHCLSGWSFKLAVHCHLVAKLMRKAVSPLPLTSSCCGA